MHHSHLRGGIYEGRSIQVYLDTEAVVQFRHASVVELVDTTGLGPVAARCGGSSPPGGRLECGFMIE